MAKKLCEVCNQEVVMYRGASLCDSCNMRSNESQDDPTPEVMDFGQVPNVRKTGKTSCVACSEKIMATAALCRFCNTRQDSLEFQKVKSQAAVDLPDRTARKILLGVGAGVVVLATLGSVLLATERSRVVPEIEASITKQVYKLSVLSLMGPLADVTCTPQGISIVLPETTYSCFAQDNSGGGLIFKAEMNWSTGLYSYGLDRG